MSQAVNLTAYFERIGFAGSIAPVLATLEQLIALHTATIPYENLSRVQGQAVALDQKSLEAKMLAGRRGGEGSEHAVLLARMLADLDFGVKLYRATGLFGGIGQHMLVGVQIAGASYLVDPGFGPWTPSAPLRLRNDIEQETPHGLFRLTANEGVTTVSAQIEGEWVDLYRFEPATVLDLDTVTLPTAEAATEPPELLASIIAGSARHVLAGALLVSHEGDTPPQSHVIASTAELYEVLTGTFGLTLPAIDMFEAVLAAILGLEPTTPVSEDAPSPAASENEQ